MQDAWKCPLVEVSGGLLRKLSNAADWLLPPADSLQRRRECRVSPILFGRDDVQRLLVACTAILLPRLIN